MGYGERWRYGRSGNVQLQCWGTLIDENNAPPSVGLGKEGLVEIDRWIIIHWFELTALALLGLNLWFVIEVLKVLTAVKEGLLLLGKFFETLKK